MKDLSDHMQADPLAKQGSNAIKEIAVSMTDFPSPLDPTLNCQCLTYVQWQEMGQEMGQGGGAGRWGCVARGEPWLML